MKKKVTNEVIEKIAEGMRKDLLPDFINNDYEYYYNILQEAIEEVTEQDDLIKRIDIGKEFTDYINAVLASMNYPSRYELDNNSQALINTLYNEYFECLESIVEDVKEEYTDVYIEIENNKIVVTAED